MWPVSEKSYLERGEENATCQCTRIAEWYRKPPEVVWLASWSDLRQSQPWTHGWNMSSVFTLVWMYWPMGWHTAVAIMPKRWKTALYYNPEANKTKEQQLLINAKWMGCARDTTSRYRSHVYTTCKCGKYVFHIRIVSRQDSVGFYVHLWVSSVCVKSTLCSDWIFPAHNADNHASDNWVMADTCSHGAIHEYLL